MREHEEHVAEVGVVHDHLHEQRGGNAWQAQVAAGLSRGAQPREIAGLVHHIPVAERGHVWSYLHQHRGNGFVQAVIAATTQPAHEPAAETGTTADATTDPVALLAAIKAGETSIQIGGDAKFQANILGMFATLASKPNGLDLLAQLAKSPHPARIEPLEMRERSQYMTTMPDDEEARLQKADGTPGAGTGTTISLNPAFPASIAHDKDGNEIASPTFVNIAHELVHALHNAQGRNVRNEKAHSTQHDNREEEVTIEGEHLSENAIRKEHGLPLRGSHGGGPAQTERTRLIDRYEKLIGDLMTARHRPELATELQPRMLELVAACDQVLALDELWEATPSIVTYYREQATRIANYGAYRATIWKQFGPQITAGYAQLRDVLVAGRKSDAGFYDSVFRDAPAAARTPEQFAAPDFGKLERGAAMTAIQELEQIIDQAVMFDGDTSAAHDAAKLLWNCIRDLAPPSE